MVSDAVGVIFFIFFFLGNPVLYCMYYPACMNDREKKQFARKRPHFAFIFRGEKVSGKDEKTLLLVVLAATGA